jgi:hypothetical protein
MAENIPTSPGGGPIPPRPAEASKVQPKKETVRINLPPKPTAAPTIKLPTLAPGAPPPASGSAAPVAAAAPAPAKAAAPAARPTSSGAPQAASVTTVAAPASKPAPAPAPRPMAPVVSGVTGLDKGLAIGALVACLGALGTVIYLVYVLKDTV